MKIRVWTILAASLAGVASPAWADSESCSIQYGVLAKKTADRHQSLVRLGVCDRKVVLRRIERDFIDFLKVCPGHLGPNALQQHIDALAALDNSSCTASTDRRDDRDDDIQEEESPIDANNEKSSDSGEQAGPSGSKGPKGPPSSKGPIRNPSSPTSKGPKDVKGPKETKGPTGPKKPPLQRDEEVELAPLTPPKSQKAPSKAPTRDTELELPPMEAFRGGAGNAGAAGASKSAMPSMKAMEKCMAVLNDPALSQQQKSKDMVACMSAAQGK